MYRRYAVYWRPPPGPLADFGASWLGWDPATGTARDVGVRSAWVATPARYGLHATLKPPMRLRDGATEADLIRAVDRLAEQLAPVQMGALVLTAMGRFLALVPAAPPPQLAGLADMVVERLDALRAPLSEAELARRRAAGLSAAQEARLQRWGYPHVMEGFRFHVTLTGAGPEAQRAAARDDLRPRLAALPLADVVIEELTVLGEDDAGRFHDIHRARLGAQ